MLIPLCAVTMENAHVQRIAQKFPSIKLNDSEVYELFLSQNKLPGGESIGVSTSVFIDWHVYLVKLDRPSPMCKQDTYDSLFGMEIEFCLSTDCFDVPLNTVVQLSLRSKNGISIGKLTGCDKPIFFNNLRSKKDKSDRTKKMLFLQKHIEGHGDKYIKHERRGVKGISRYYIRRDDGTFFVAKKLEDVVRHVKHMEGDPDGLSDSSEVELDFSVEKKRDRDLVTTDGNCSDDDTADDCKRQRPC